MDEVADEDEDKDENEGEDADYDEDDDEFCRLKHRCPAICQPRTRSFSSCFSGSGSATQHALQEHGAAQAHE